MNAPVARINKNHFWLDVKVEAALNVLQAHELYIGRIIDSSTYEDGTGEQLCLEEKMPPDARLLPQYVASLPVYNEKVCRDIFRQVVNIVKISHDNSMAHRNIHINNFVVRKVRMRSTTTIVICFSHT